MSLIIIEFLIEIVGSHVFKWICIFCLVDSWNPWSRRSWYIRISRCLRRNFPLRQDCPLRRKYRWSGILGQGYMSIGPVKSSPNRPDKYFGPFRNYWPAYGTSLPSTQEAGTHPHHIILMFIRTLSILSLYDIVISMYNILLNVFYILNYYFDSFISFTYNIMRYQLGYILINISSVNSFWFA